MEYQNLTVHHYSENKEEEKRMTLCPVNITVVAADIEDTVINGRSVRKVTVLFMDGGSIDLCVNHSDLEKMELAIGGYCLG